MTKPASDIRSQFADAARELEAANAKDELLAKLTPRRRILGIARPATMVPIGRVWRLGVLLLGQDLALYATGSITRVTDTTRPTFQSLSAEERRAYRVLATKSGLPQGETVNFNAMPIEVDAAQLQDAAGPLFLRGDEAFVRWNAAAADDSALRLANYLSDRVNLLVDPPKGT